MPSSRITSKGQITVPKVVRERLNLEPGDRILFCEQPDGTIVLEAESNDIMALAGSVSVRIKGVTVEDMHEAVRKGASARSRGRDRA